MFIRRFAISFCLFALFATLPTLGAMAQSTPPSINEKNSATAESLETKLITADFFESRFEDVLKQISKQTDVKIRMMTSCEDNSLDNETLISFQCNNMRFATLLKFLLNDFQCTWSIDDGELLILSMDESLEMARFETRVFNCSELIAKIKPRKKLRTRYNGGFGGGSGNAQPGSGGGGVFDFPSAQEEAETPAASGSNKSQAAKSQPVTVRSEFIEVSGKDQFISVITDSIDPDSWEENGGNARMASLNNVLIITQTHENIRAIENLLEQLQDAELEK